MSRTPDHPVEPLFVERWSPRAFSDEQVPDAVLATAFEAARWAPSSFNAQPWRFIVARRGDPLWPGFVSLLIPRNRLWAGRAAALIIIVSARQVERGGAPADNHSHSFDAGAAWANFSHQALLLGWHTHGIGGFDRETARSLLAVPDDYSIQAMIAVGRRGDLDDLHQDFREQERPSGRRPLNELVFEGTFGTPAFGTASRVRSNQTPASGNERNAA